MHDAQGRLTRLGRLRLHRDEAGRIVRVVPGSSGWRGLAIELDHQRRTRIWRSALTGMTRIRADAEGRPRRIDYANGDWPAIRSGRHGRPIALRAGHESGAPVATALDWRGRLLVRIVHPAEIESLRHDDDGRVIGRHVRRPHPSGELRYQ